MFQVIPNNSEESQKPIPVAKFPKLMQHRESPSLISLFISDSESICISGCHNFSFSFPGVKRIDTNHSVYYDNYNLPITIQNILE